MVSSEELAQLAEVAILHAADNFGIQLDNIFTSSDSQKVGTAFDQVLRACSKALRSNLIPADEIEPVIACYGAWLGCWLEKHRNGVWVGTGEPVPPRTKVAHRLVCPHDAVRERISDPEQQPDLAELLKQVDAWLLAEKQSTMWLEANQAAWNQKALDRRFTAFPHLLSLEEAESQLDPWLSSEGRVLGKRVLCLAAGGGTHGPLLAMAGAKVVVADVSKSMLEIDEHVAKRLGLELETIECNMSDLSRIAPQSFDIVIHPVSTCYVQDVMPVYLSIANVLKPNGLYLSQHKSAAILQWNGLSGTEHAYGLGGSCVDGSASFAAISQPAANSVEHPYRESNTFEFVHSIEALIGGLCRSGFSIEDVVEPPRGNSWARPGTAEHLASVISPYLKIKARRNRAIARNTA